MLRERHLAAGFAYYLSSRPLLAPTALQKNKYASVCCLPGLQSGDGPLGSEPNREYPAMTMSHDHPQRYALVNELHARPFPSLTVPCVAVYLAVKEPLDAANRDRGRDRAHLLALLNRHGAAHPAPEATHHSAVIGKHELKWESHTEFVTYSAFANCVPERAFDPHAAEVFPADLAGRDAGQESRLGHGAGRAYAGRSGRGDAQA
jgi:hypothetical protein